MTTRRRSGPAITEEQHAERGWTRLSLRLPPEESAALHTLTAHGESPGLVVRRLLLEAASKSSRKTGRR